MVYRQRRGDALFRFMNTAIVRRTLDGLTLIESIPSLVSNPAISG